MDVTYDFEKELSELRDDYKNQPDVKTLIKWHWETSLKNEVSRLITCGMIELAYFTKSITQEEFTNFYKMIGMF
jgi:hypothetical protein